MELQKNTLFDDIIDWLAIEYQRVSDIKEIWKKETEEKGYSDITVPTPTLVSIGSTRSGKTIVKCMIIYLHFLEAFSKGQAFTVNCYRNLLTDCATKTFGDFNMAARIMGIDKKLRFIGGNKPQIRHGNCIINFLGVSDNSEVQQAASDIAFFNEAFEISNRKFVRQVVSRCDKLVIYDGNPTDSMHWLYDELKLSHVKLFKSIYKDNKFLSPTVKHSIEQYCPWDLKDFLKIDGKWKWTVEEDKREPNKVNLEAKTANRVDWLVKGEGIPAEKEGAVYSVTWIEQMPPLEELESVRFGLDFGWTNDETAIGMVAKSGNKIFIKEIFYQVLNGKEPHEKLNYLYSQIFSIFCRDTSEFFPCEKGTMLKNTLKEEFGIKDRKFWIEIICETQDNFKDLHFVAGLKNLATQDKENSLLFYKMTKKPRIEKRIENMKSYDLHVVRSANIEREFNNYTYDMIGDEITTVVSKEKKGANNYDHLLDAIGYAIYQRYRKL